MRGSGDTPVFSTEIVNIHCLQTETEISNLLTVLGFFFLTN